MTEPHQTLDPEPETLSPQTLPKAILFDLDDTILKFDTLAEKFWLAACEAFEPELPGVSAEKMLGAVHEYREWYWGDPDRHKRGRLNLEVARREVVGGALQLLGIEDPELAGRMGDSYSADRDAAVEPFPGAISTLNTLRAAGVRLGLITNGNGETQRAKVVKHGLVPLFDHILIEGEFGMGKPEERVYLHSLERLDATPSESWMVGDNLEWEVAAPQRLGITGIWVDSRDRGLPESSAVQPDRIIGSLPELLT